MRLSAARLAYTLAHTLAHNLGFALPLLLLAAGCNRLSPGDTADLAPPRSVNVILIRGYLDWYSTGIDRLTDSLNKSGFLAEAFREEQWGDLSDQILNSQPHSLILIGFSYGADDVILIARRLNDRHLPVDLLITIDPVTPGRIPTNVKRCVNFFEPNGFWDLFPWLRGVPVNGDPGQTPQNINIRLRADLDEPGTSHGTIAGNAKLHRAILELISHCKLLSASKFSRDPVI